MQVAFGRVRRDALRIWAGTPQKPYLPGLGEGFNQLNS